MRFLISVLAALLLLPASASADRSDCYPRKSKTVKRTKHARIYDISVNVGSGQRERRTFACLYRTGKRRPLDNPRQWEYASGPWKLAGRYVMYGWSWAPADSYESRPGQVVVMNLRTGRWRAAVNWSPDTDNEPVDDPPTGQTVRAVLRSNGNAAWTSWDEAARNGVEVWTLIKGRATRVDAGDDVDARSLRLEGGRATWRKAGATRSTALR